MRQAFSADAADVATTRTSPARLSRADTPGERGRRRPAAGSLSSGLARGQPSRRASRKIRRFALSIFSICSTASCFQRPCQAPSACGSLGRVWTTLLKSGMADEAEPQDPYDVGDGPEDVANKEEKEFRG